MNEKIECAKADITLALILTMVGTALLVHAGLYMGLWNDGISSFTESYPTLEEMFEKNGVSISFEYYLELISNETRQAQAHLDVSKSMFRMGIGVFVLALVWFIKGEYKLYKLAYPKYH